MFGTATPGVLFSGVKVSRAKGGAPPAAGLRRNEDAMRVAIYARVSTEDKGQDPENQLRDLRAWCASAGHTIVREYVDQESGRSARRKAFAQLLEDAHRRQFNCVV